MGLRTFKNESSPTVELNTKQKTPVEAGVELIMKKILFQRIHIAGNFTN